MPGDRQDGVVHVDDPSSAKVIRQRRRLHRVMLGLVVVVLGVAVLDGTDVVDLLGPDEATVQARGRGYVLRVQHPTVTRPALATVFRITVERSGGFDEPVQIGITRRYLEMWDANAILPAPSGETAVGKWIVWEFDPPPGDALTITYEARVEPGVQTGRHGSVAVFVDDQPAVTTEFHTMVRP